MDYKPKNRDNNRLKLYFLFFLFGGDERRRGEEESRFKKDAIRE